MNISNTKMNISNTKEWTLGAIGFIVSCIGAFIESWSLQGDLDHRYPFKIMSVPPSEYYAVISHTIASFAPYLAMLAGFVSFLILRRKKILAGIIPVIACPLIYILGLWYLVLNSPYRDQLQSPINYDNSSAAMRHGEFNLGAMNILFFSIFVYLVFVILTYGFNYCFLSKRIS